MKNSNTEETTELFKKQHAVLVQSGDLKPDTKPYAAVTTHTIKSQKYVTPGWVQSTKALETLLAVYPKLHGALLAASHIDHHHWRMAKFSLYTNYQSITTGIIKECIERVGFEKIRKSLIEVKDSAPEGYSGYIPDNLETMTLDDYAAHCHRLVFPKLLTDIFDRCNNDMVSHILKGTEISYTKHHWCYIDRLQLDKILDFESSVAHVALTLTLGVTLYDKLKGMAEAAPSYEEFTEMSNDFEKELTSGSDEQSPKSPEAEVLTGFEKTMSRVLITALSGFERFLVLGVHQTVLKNDNPEKVVYIS